MGILDEAIREHLDLKRKHGAREAELEEIQDEAFGSGDQPDPFTSGELFSEAPGAAPAAAPAIEVSGEPERGSEEPTRLVEADDLGPPPEPAEPSDEPISPPEGLRQIPGQEELPGQDEIPGQEALLEPERGGEELAEPPSPSESLEELIAEEEPFPEDAAAPPPAPETAERPGPVGEPETPTPGPEEPPEGESSLEPESSVPDPPPPPPIEGSEPPGRARGRVDVPTEEHPAPEETGDVSPVPPDSGLRPEPLDSMSDLPPGDEPPAEEPQDESAGPGLYDFETDEKSLSPEEPAAAEEDDFEALGPAEEEAPYLEEEEPYADEPPSGPEADERSIGSTRQTFEEEEAEEDLWFEKGPPQDFDFE